MTTKITSFTKKFFSRYTFQISRHQAFTLAEVLITLGIIGVVAAILIPNLMEKVQDWQFKQAWKKEYAILTQAINAVYADDGVGFELSREVAGDWVQMPRYYCKLEKKLKVIKSGMNCPENPDSIPIDSAQWPVSIGPKKGYWHVDDNWKMQNGTLLHSNTTYFPMSAILVDGAMIQFTCYSEIQVDVNGYKKPNVVGKDIFHFLLKNKGTTKTTFWETANGCTSAPYYTWIDKNNYVEDCKNGSGWGCSAYYLLGN